MTAQLLAAINEKYLLSNKNKEFENRVNVLMPWMTAGNKLSLTTINAKKLLLNLQGYKYGIHVHPIVQPSEWDVDLIFIIG